jgi:hypothetical protein
MNIESVTIAGAGIGLSERLIPCAMFYYASQGTGAQRIRFLALFAEPFFFEWLHSLLFRSRLCTHHGVFS